MIATWKQYEGQAVDGIPLIRLLGGNEASAVYLGELAGEPCAIKLVPAEEAEAQIPLARWQQASKLSHPHLTRILQWGRARLDGPPLVYLAMEYAEEELSAVDRPLTPKETREMLAPAVSALAYLHSQKFAHGRIRPSNILSVKDVLKISGDAPLRLGERRAETAASSPYDPPELAVSGVTAAGDVWSLGVTLVEALTKALPEFGAETGPPRLPASLKPDSFREVATGCLHRDPARRWTVADISQWLERGVVPAPKPAPRRYLVPVAAAAAVLVAGAFALQHFTQTQRSETPAASQTNITKAPAPSAAVAVQTPPPVEAPPPNAGKPSKAAPEPSPLAAAPAVVAPPPVVAKEQPPKPQPPSTKTPQADPPAADPSASAEPRLARQVANIPAEVSSPDVLRPVVPDVPSKARASIHGKVPIVVRVNADTDGTVIEAKVESGASSKYFAEISLQAARQWKFVPGEGQRAFNVRFEYTPNAQHPVSTQVTPTH